MLRPLDYEIMEMMRSSEKLLLVTRFRTRFERAQPIPNSTLSSGANGQSYRRRVAALPAMEDARVDCDSGLELLAEAAPLPTPEPEAEASADPEWSGALVHPPQPVTRVSVSRLPSGVRSANPDRPADDQVECGERAASGRPLLPSPAHSGTSLSPASASLLSLPLCAYDTQRTRDSSPQTSRPAACASSWLAQRLAQRAGVAFRETLSVPFYRFEHGSSVCSGQTRSLPAAAQFGRATAPLTGFSDPHAARQRFPSRPLGAAVSSRLEHFMGGGSRMLRSYSQRGALRRVLRTTVPTRGEMELLGAQLETMQLQTALLSRSSTPNGLETAPRTPALVLVGHSESQSRASRSTTPELSVLLRGRQPPAAARRGAAPRPPTSLDRTSIASFTTA